ncbi:hypothetical protein APR50_39410 [Variovorax paradoxus]|jgi:hypothetical protein|uniref:hypothetical protein n=1 Tax=Variovorax paradoxus TaxID=34073 RepID=UPI0006E5A794|nr:hypothetical protein APR52_42565 [Variovorax paradoxus]KPU92783.1 hypothetical protein APR50_39410 [Variovorax paradoxus]KPU93936.1 hypothetical protein APR49_38770 [Variovorax paradoxus]KPV14586.1 hypothetical protein APR51_38370 [Variovorax paradoxus]KPV21169.1 hypothetical protein APR48_38180 [Variovorax paradoxus]
MSQREAWSHATSTLRKAGGQLKRKVDAVMTDLGAGGTLAKDLGSALPSHPREVHGWIVDTSIENDHQRFGGFLKVSLEEVLIALRDDRELLHDPEGLFGNANVTAHAALHPDGFSCQRFVLIIETESVWDGV